MAKYQINMVLKIVLYKIIQNYHLAKNLKKNIDNVMG